MAVDNISTNSHIINIFHDSHSSLAFKIEHNLYLNL